MLSGLSHEFEQAVGDGSGVLRNERLELAEKDLGNFEGRKRELAPNPVFEEVVF